MLKRKAIASIKNWVNTKNKKCLVVQGARQTGKTYIIERFAEDNYEELLEINFKQMVSAVDIFSGDLTVDNMVMAMRFRFPEKKILPGKTLIFLDEIQECQEAGAGVTVGMNPFNLSNSVMSCTSFSYVLLRLKGYKTWTSSTYDSTAERDIWQFVYMFVLAVRTFQHRYQVSQSRNVSRFCLRFHFVE